ncbi:MAG: prephenate dehydrogenase [Lentisphaerae bacterium]|nr:prephenate dehydrogenase [Lentisphaerota bacterium]
MDERPVVSVLGLGLLGASFCMELEGKYRRAGWSRNPENRRKAMEKGVVEFTVDTPEEAFSAGDIIVLCLPIPVIMEYIRKYASYMKPGAVLTDIGSVKGVIEQAALENPGVHFIGSHPMAGTEKNGFDNAFKGLYHNADVFVVPPPGAEEADIVKVEEMWQKIGTRTTRIDSKAHDELVAGTSHVPHILASATTLGVLDVPEDARITRFSGCATGFRDSSRVASSSPVMWREIVEQNTPAVLTALTELRKHLDEFENMVRNGDFDGFEKKFAKGKELRDQWIRWKKY